MVGVGLAVVLMDNRFYKSDSQPLALPVTCVRRPCVECFPRLFLLRTVRARPCGQGAPFARHLLCLALLALGWGAFAEGALAQTPPNLNPAEPALRLQTSPRLDEALPRVREAALPIFLQGDRLQGRPDLDLIVEGNVTLRKAGTVIRADRIEYESPTDQARASGNVRINRKGDVFEGPLMELKIDAFEGFFNQPRYHFIRNGGQGEAERADFLDASRTVIHNATYTTCLRQPGPHWLPDWILRAARIELDHDEDVAIAHGAVLRFKDVPILPIPAVSFPLSDQRKSGFLPPTMGVGSDNGVEVGVPYYWNIAPNRDATLTPKLMTHRGIDLGGEFRYLEPSYNGILRGNYTPSDRLTDTNRWGVSLAHQQAEGWSFGGVRLGLNVNRVSDDTYWRDFTFNSTSPNATTFAGAAITQRLLPNDAVALWGYGAFSSTLRVLRWQTLQDPSAPITPPYDRAPQWSGRFALTNVNGLDWSVDLDATRFESDPLRTQQSNARRAFALLQVSRPWLAPAGFVTPKLQWHAATYQYDSALADGRQSASSAVPTFSLDGGLVLEREVRLWGQDLVQTLEPRAFYVYTPYRDQSILSNYDTAQNDFNFASIFTENAFTGHDKIADNNLLTLGLTTRFLDSASGAQIARFGVAQRLRFEDQRVTLNSSTSGAQQGFSDVLLGASLNLDERWVLDSTVQYNAKTEKSVRSVVGVRYNPSPYRVLNAAYRFQSDNAEQLDLSWQWPLNDLWGDAGQNLGAGRGQGPGRYYGVGRVNYSLNERRLVDTVWGVEYDAGCWLARVVLERVQTSSSTATGRLMFQLEFVGFTRLGISPLQTLTQNIARYQNLRDFGGSNSRFGNYD